MLLLNFVLVLYIYFVTFRRTRAHTHLFSNHTTRRASKNEINMSLYIPTLRSKDHLRMTYGDNGKKSREIDRIISALYKVNKETYVRSIAMSIKQRMYAFDDWDANALEND